MQKMQARIVAVVSAALALTVSTVRADDYTFTNSAGGSFNAGGNWDLGSVPSAGDTARFTNSASCTVGFSADAQNAKAVFDAAGGNVTLGITNAEWSLSDRLEVGPGAGVNPGVFLSVGTLTVTNNGAGLLDIGTGGAGSFTIQGATATSAVDRILLTNVINGVGNSFLNLRYGVLSTFAGASILMATNGAATAGLLFGDFRVGPTNGSAVTMTWNILGGTYLVNVPSAGGEPNPAFMIGGNAPGLRGVVNVSGEGTVLSNYGGGRLLIGAGHAWGNPNGNSGSGNNQLNITGGAKVYQVGFTLLGWNGRDNKLFVSGTNSLFSSPGGISLGKSGGGNSLIVNNGAQLVGGSVGIGEAGSCDNSLVLISDTNTLAVMSYLFPSANNSSVIVSNGATLRITSTSGSPFVFGDHNAAGNSNKLIVTGSGSILTNWGSTTFLVPNHAARGFCSNMLCKVNNGGAFYTGDLYIGGYHGDFKGGSNSVEVSTVVSDPQSLVMARSKIWITKHLWDKTVNLVVTNGAAVLSQNAEIGYFGFTPTTYHSMGGSALVTGSGSVWSNQSDILLGSFTNSTGELMVYAGGRVITSRVREGIHAFGTGTVVIADSGSTLLATSAFYVGETGQGRLTIKDGGSLVVTNTGSTGLLDIRRGTLTVANNGSVTVDRLTFTNTVDSLTFQSGPDGLGSIKVKGAMTLTPGSKLKIDLTGYTLTPGQRSDVLKLVEYGTLPTPFNSGDIQLVNPKFCASLTQGDGSNDAITLTVSRLGTMILMN